MRKTHDNIDQSSPYLLVNTCTKHPHINTSHTNMKSKIKDLAHKIPGMPSQSKNFECVSHDSVTDPGLVYY